jgi:hypothetical protein
MSFDLHRQRRLRDRACGRGASEMAVTGQRVEIAELDAARVDHQNYLITAIKKINFT